jgi:uncharacterized integral membrane protein
MSAELPSSGHGRDAAPQRSRKERARLVAVAAVSAVLALFAALNLDQVQVNWIVGKFDTPLILVIAVSVLIGAALGYLASRRRASD